MNDEVKVMVKFTATEGKLSYTDALYYELVDYSSIPQKTIADTKQARFDAWKAEIAKPQPPLDIDKALVDCQSQIDFYTQLKADYTAQKGGGK